MEGAGARGHRPSRGVTGHWPRSSQCMSVICTCTEPSTRARVCMRVHATPEAGCTALGLSRLAGCATPGVPPSSILHRPQGAAFCRCADIGLPPPHIMVGISNVPGPGMGSGASGGEGNREKPLAP